MNATEARAYLEDHLRWQDAPVLTLAEVDRLMARVVKSTDANGLEPGDAGYVTTYTATNVDREVGKGWLMKAGKVAGQYGVAVGGGTRFDRQQQYEHCTAMARQYGAGGRIGVVALTTSGA